MAGSLDRLTIRGFKSIRELDGLELGDLNVLIGANGSGKSNLLSFFRVWQSWAAGGLNDYVRSSGGISDILHNGRKVTSQVDFEAVVNGQVYRLSIKPGPDEGFGFWFEHVNDGRSADDGDDKMLKFRGGGEDRAYPSMQAEDSAHVASYGKYQDPGREMMGLWQVYHFEDTSHTAAMRHAEIVEDNRYLRHDASNIAPVLLRLRTEDPRSYRDILNTCSLVAPFLDDFLLEPREFGSKTKVSLAWKAKGSDYPMQPYHLPGGFIRFICLATALLQPDPPSVIVIDEPELGLDPEAICMLAELMDSVREITQVVVATQSSLLVDQFAIEDVVVVKRKGGQSTYKRLKRSDFNVWLEDYAVGELWVQNVIQGDSTHE